MEAPASSSLFMSLTNVWRLLSLRSDVDDIILELLGHFSLEKIYAETDKETYQHLVITLLAQLNAIYHIQRFTVPSENLQIGWYLGFIASWEVTLRSVEFALQVILEGRDSLWEAQSLRDKYLAEFLLSALRLLTLHPKAPTNQRAKDRRERFARVHRSLERLYDSYPGPKSFLLLVCKEVTDALRTEPNALALPLKFRYEMPNLASDLYPLPDCLTSQYVATVIPQDGFSGNWLSQFLTLRDVSLFVVGASIQYSVNKETRDVRLQSSSARTRNAVLHALENLRIPSHLSKMDLVSTFSETFRTILPDTPSLVRQSSTDSRRDENEMDAIDALCVRLRDRQVVHRMSDREMMHGVSEITRNIAILDDPSGQLRNTRPKLYVSNCGELHFAGESQLRQMKGLKIPHDPGEDAEVPLPPKSRCLQCGENITKAREISLARHTYDLLKPLEANADTINVERHLPTQFHLAPPKAETGILFSPAYGSTLIDSTIRSPEVGPVSPQQVRSPLRGSISENQFRTMSPSQSHLIPHSPVFQQGVDCLRAEFSSDYLTSSDGVTQIGTLKYSEPPSASRTVIEAPFSPDSIETRQAYQYAGNQRSKSSVAVNPVPIQVLGSRTVPVLSAPPDKGKSGWRSKLTRSRKESHKPSADSSSLSSTTLESQRLDEVSLKSLTNVSKGAVKGKSGKNINVQLSQNSTHALFWTPSSIQLLDLGESPPALVRMISTESTCVLAAVTKVHLAYIIGTRDQKLTLRIVNLVEPAAPVIDYRMSSSPWCKSISISPKENYVVVGFENSLVRFFKTTASETPREDRLHPYHEDCKDCPQVDSLSFSNDGLVILASTRNPKSGTIQVFAWRFPFITVQELSTCRYRVPLHQSEDNGITSAIFRSGQSCDENLICITTWTQSGLPILIQPEDDHRSEIKGRLGSRIQCAAFSPSGKDLAMVNEKGHLYQISSMNSNPMNIRKIATSKELTAKSQSFDMAFMTLSDEETIVLAWADSSKSTGFIKRIPIRSNGGAGIAQTPTVVHSAVSISHTHAHVELEGDANQIRKPPAELIVTEERAAESDNDIDILMDDIKGKLVQDYT